MTEAEWLASEDPAEMLGLFAPEGAIGISPRKLRLFACACVRQAWGRLTDPRSRAAVEVAELFADGGATEGSLRVARGAADDAHADGPDDDRVVTIYDAWACCLLDIGEGARLVLTTPHSSPPAVMAALLRDIVGNPWRPVWWADDPKKHARPRATFGGPSDDGAKGHPARVEMRRAWLTPTVLALARAAYDERVRVWKGRIHDHDEETGYIDTGTLDPARLAVLADALEEAGCDSEDLLMHLRGWGRCFCRTGPSHGMEELCGGRGWLKAGPHVRGCWAVDLVLGKE
jgi:hypothetical protein